MFTPLESQIKTFFAEDRSINAVPLEAMHKDLITHGACTSKITCDEQGEVSVLHVPLTLPEYHPTADEAVDILAAAWQMSRREVARLLMSFNFGDIQ